MPVLDPHIGIDLPRILFGRPVLWHHHLCSECGKNFWHVRVAFPRHRSSVQGTSNMFQQSLRAYGRAPRRQEDGASPHISSVPLYHLEHAQTRSGTCSPSVSPSDRCLDRRCIDTVTLSTSHRRPSAKRLCTCPARGRPP